MSNRSRSKMRATLLALASMAMVPVAAQAALVTQYSFEGNTNDSVGTRNGTLVGGSYSNDSAKGVGGGQSLDLSAINDYMRYNVLAGDTISGSYTVSAWVKPTSGSGTSQTWFSTRNPGNSSFDAKFQNDTQIHGDIGTGSAWITTAADSNIYDYRANQWQHIVYSVNGTGFSIYANGVKVGGGTYAASNPLLIDANHDIIIGTAFAPSNPTSENFNGRIDEVKIYNTALTQAQVLADLAPAGAVRVTSLYSTGVDNAGNALGGGINDPHYTLTGPPAGGPIPDATVLSDGFPIGSNRWLPNNPSSTWIGPVVNGLNTNDAYGPSGNYTYTTTFDLAGFDIASAVIHGLWATDNAGTDILLNGVSVLNGQGSTGAGSLRSFSVWTPFSISSGFKEGVNTLQFVVNNSDTGPQGLRVELNAFAVPVPEPTSLGLVGAGLASLAFRRRRR